MTVCIANDELIASLKAEAYSTHPLINRYDEVEITDYLDNHINDCYEIGRDHGRTLLARQILDKLGIPW